MKLIPLVNRPDGGLTPSKLEPIKEISQEEFLENYADNPRIVTVDGKDGVTVHNGWFLVK